MAGLSSRMLRALKPDDVAKRNILLNSAN